MKRYAQISDGVVVAITDAKDTILDVSMVDITGQEIGLGQSWDGATFGVGPAASARTRLTQLEFRNLFTLAEKTAIYTAKSTSVSVEIFLDDLSAAEFVDTTDPMTIAGVNALESASLLAPGRGAQILAGIS